MKHQDLVQALARRAGLTPGQARALLDALSAEAAEALSRGEPLSVRGLGRFEPAWHEGRTLRSIHDGRLMMLDGRWTLRFRPSGALKEALAARSPQAWRDPRHQAAWRAAETLISDLALYHPERAPRGLTADADLATVHVACRLAFKNLWTRVIASYEERVPEDVRAARDYPGEAARARWGT